MPKFRHYSPQLSKQIVRRLSYQAKAEHIPMTVLANQLMEEALRSTKRINTQKVVEERHITQPT